MHETYMHLAAEFGLATVAIFMAVEFSRYRDRAAYFERELKTCRDLQATAASLYRYEVSCCRELQIQLGNALRTQATPHELKIREHRRRRRLRRRRPVYDPGSAPMSRRFVADAVHGYKGVNVRTAWKSDLTMQLLKDEKRRNIALARSCGPIPLP